MSDRMKILVTGGKGFIGSAVVRHLINETDHEVVNVDKMTYAATEGSTQSVADSPRLTFEQADICDIDRITEIFAEHSPDAVMHLAAESHVDRSIDGPAAFVQTNLIGTFTMLEAARAAGVTRFHHISTDEVFGSLGPDDPAFTETTPYGREVGASAFNGSLWTLSYEWQCYLIVAALVAFGVLKNARIVDTLDEALDGITHLCATAMTPRDFGPPTRAPREHFKALLNQELLAPISIGLEADLML